MVTKQDLTNIFERKFDHIFLIHLIDATDRMPAMMMELDRVGLLDCKNFEFYYDVKTPMDETMFVSFKMVLNHEDSIGSKKLTMNHYKLYKIIKACGYKNTLILEDDVRFLKDLDSLYTGIATIPDDENTFDILLLDKITLFSYEQTLKENNLYLNYATYYGGEVTDMFSTAMYTVTEKGADYLIRQVETFYMHSKLYNIDDETQASLNWMNSDHYTNKNLFPTDNVYNPEIDNLMKNVYTVDDSDIRRGYSYNNLCIQLSVYHTYRQNAEINSVYRLNNPSELFYAYSTDLEVFAKFDENNEEPNDNDTQTSNSSTIPEWVNQNMEKYDNDISKFGESDINELRSLSEKLKNSI